MTISATAIPTTIAASPYEKQESNSENLIRNKREDREISDYVTNKNLGIIRPNNNGEISDLRILNAFVRANQNYLHYVLRETSQRSRILFVSETGEGWATIRVRSGPFPYRGYVQVTFNEGNIPTPGSTYDDSNNHNGSNWQSRFNLSTQRNLQLNLGDLVDKDPIKILRSFMFYNQNLPLDLANILRVSVSSNYPGQRARIYVPEGNSRYVGSVNASFSPNFYNARFHDEI